MKSKVLMTVAVVAASAIVGGATAYGVSVASQNSRYDTSSSRGSSPDTATENDFSDTAGNHFTSFAAENYPDLTYAAENAVKAVVGVIKTEEIPQMGFGDGGMGIFGNPFFEFFGIPGQGQPQGRGDRSEQQQPEVQYHERLSGGSGVIISPDGYIVTNHHVVDNASKLTVKMPDGTTYDAKLVGTDADTEIALIKIEQTDLPSIPFGSSKDLRLGEWVLAIGNPYELHSTITAGIVSAKSRSLEAIGNSGIESFIQTDAAVNPGNSGGALVNTRGELVGINTLIKSPTGSYAGYSFAVPETIVRKVVNDIREYGAVQRALIGISYRAIDDTFIREQGKDLGIDTPGGIYVAMVVEGGAAEAAGIKKGDIITEIDGSSMRDAASIAEVIGLKRPGDKIQIVAKRGDKVKQFDVVLRNKAGKSELVAKETFDTVASLGGEFANIDLSKKQQNELGIKGGIQVTSVGREGILARANVQKGYIITHINGTAIYSVNDLYRIDAKIKSIDGFYPNGRSVTYSIVE